MSKTLAFFDRFIVFLIGLLLLLAGLLPAAMYWDIPYVSEYVNRLNRGELTELPNYTWYINALIATAVVLFLLGLWFVLANIRSRAFSNRAIEAADPEHGETVINVQRLGDAACAALTQSEAVQKADCRVAVERERPTATFTVTADPAYSMDDLIDIVERANEDFRVANHTMEIDTVWKLHFDRVAA